ncbi:MAG TPA: transketolase C-terminal domain-containing protein [Chloroflexota bacterium]|nr:transketolase C-terminal domain-containing protein [Chloroflexota bacterium]
MAQMSFLEARNRAIADAMSADPTTILIGGFGGPGAPEGGFGKAFGEARVRSVPISEEGFAGAAVGAALFGLRPIVTFSNASFMFDAWEPVLNEAALLRYMSGGQFAAPIVFHMLIGLRAGWAAQHSQTSQAMLCNAPGLVVVAPGTPAAAYELMRTAIASDDPVVYVDTPLLHREIGEVDGASTPRPVRARVLRAGNDVTVVAVSGMVPRALAVAERLARDGIGVEVIDPQVLSPLDRGGILESVARTGRLVAVDEGQLSCGVASEIVSSVSEHGFDLLKSAPRRVAIPDVPVPPNPTQIEQVTPNESRIEAAVRAALD